MLVQRSSSSSLRARVRVSCLLACSWATTPGLPRPTSSSGSGRWTRRCINAARVQGPDRAALDAAVACAAALHSQPRVRFLSFPALPCPPAAMSPATPPPRGRLDLTPACRGASPQLYGVPLRLARDVYETLDALLTRHPPGVVLAVSRAPLLTVATPLPRFPPSRHPRPPAAALQACSRPGATAGAKGLAAAACRHPCRLPSPATCPALHCRLQPTLSDCLPACLPALPPAVPGPCGAGPPALQRSGLRQLGGEVPLSQGASTPCGEPAGPAGSAAGCAALIRQCWAFSLRSRLGSCVCAAGSRPLPPACCAMPAGGQPQVPCRCVECAGGHAGARAGRGAHPSPRAGMLAGQGRRRAAHAALRVVCRSTFMRAHWQTAGHGQCNGPKTALALPCLARSQCSRKAQPQPHLACCLPLRPGPLHGRLQTAGRLTQRRGGRPPGAAAGRGGAPPPPGRQKGAQRCSRACAARRRRRQRAASQPLLWPAGLPLPGAGAASPS